MQTSSRTGTLADSLVLASQRRDVLLVMGSSILLGVLSQLEIRIPWTPVPITLQTLGVFLIAATLGAKRGSAAMALYLAQGAAGLPVFAGGGAGVAHLLGPTGGYLFSYVPAAFLIGFFAEHGWDRTPMRALLAMVMGTVIIYSMGLAVLSVFVPPSQLLNAGLWPFLPGACVKLLAASLLLPFAWSLLQRSGLGPRR